MSRESSSTTTFFIPPSYKKRNTSVVLKSNGLSSTSSGGCARGDSSAHISHSSNIAENGKPEECDSIQSFVAAATENILPQNSHSSQGRGSGGNHNTQYSSSSSTPLHRQRFNAKVNGSYHLICTDDYCNNSSEPSNIIHSQHDNMATPLTIEIENTLQAEEDPDAFNGESSKAKKKRKFLRPRRNSKLDRIIKFLEDRRIKEDELDQLQDLQMPRLRKVLNIIFVTFGVCFLLAVIVVIIYTEIKGEPNTTTH